MQVWEIVLLTGRAAFATDVTRQHDVISWRHGNVTVTAFGVLTSCFPNVAWLKSRWVSCFSPIIFPLIGSEHIAWNLESILQRRKHRSKENTNYRLIGLPLPSLRDPSPKKLGPNPHSVLWRHRNGMWHSGTLIGPFRSRYRNLALWLAITTVTPRTTIKSVAMVYFLSWKWPYQSSMILRPEMIIAWYKWATLSDSYHVFLSLLSHGEWSVCYLVVLALLRLHSDGVRTRPVLAVYHGTQHP